jgi:hypothetical protein
MDYVAERIFRLKNLEKLSPETKSKLFVIEENVIKDIYKRNTVSSELTWI